MPNFTTIGKGHGAACVPATPASWQEARQNPELAQLCQQIESCSDEDEQKRLKDRLPVWTPRCGEFRSNHRSQQDAICPLNRQMFDIDEKGLTNEILSLMKPKSVSEVSEGSEVSGGSEVLHIGNFEILMVEESVRRGTHVLVIPPSGMSLNDAQYEFSKLIGLPVDPAVKNVAGCIYMVPEDHVRYQSPKFFEPGLCEVSDSSKEFQEVSKGSSNDLTLQLAGFHQELARLKEPSETALGLKPTETTQGYPQDYDGIPYKTLVEALSEQLGGVPVHGSRNNFLFSMACHLRYVCNDDARWIMQILPTYGEDRTRVERTIQSACNRAQSRYIPQVVQRAISIARSRSELLNLGNSEIQKSGDSVNPYRRPTPPELPKRLPKLIQLLISKVDPMYRAAVAQSVFPPLGAHLHGVRTRYIDNSEADLGGFMNILMAKQSIGKGSVNMPIDLIMEDVCQRDAYSRDQEKQWKQQCKSSKANEKKPARPEGLCVQYLMSNMTNAALVQRLIDAESAGGKFLYTRLDEIEMLDQIKASGGATASELIRLAHNQALYGQERVGTESVTGTPPLRFNFNASTTVPTGQAYFAKGLTNGTLSRLTLATIIRHAGHRGIPRFGNYDEQFRRQLSPYISNLNAATGLIECRQANRMAEQFCEENADLSELSDDDVFETLSFRACRMVHDKAKLLYIANGYQWDRSIVDFCRWSMHYDLWLKLHFFGNEMRQLTEDNRLPSVSGPQNLLDSVPDRFSVLDLTAVYRAQGRHGDVMQLLYTWTSRGYIEQDTTTQDYIKTDKYLSRHQKITG